MKQFSSRLFDNADTTDLIVPESHLWNVPAENLHTAPDSPLVQAITETATASVPWNYEPNYSYPLIVWLTGKELSASEALDCIAQLSPQNYLGLAIEGCELNAADGGMHPGGVAELSAAEDRIVSSVMSMRESFNIHPDRVFLAGAGTSANAALMIGLHQADWFAGAISFGGEVPALAQLLAHRREVTGHRCWLSGSTTVSQWPEDGPLAASSRTLLSMGADVTTCLDDSSTIVSRKALRQLDEWILAAIFGAGSTT